MGARGTGVGAVPRVFGHNTGHYALWSIRPGL